MREWVAPIFTKGLRSFVTGLISTLILGLSSVVCILAVSFFENKIITKKSAWRIIVGANVGTTLTPWLVLLLSFYLPTEYILIVSLIIGLVLFLSNSYVNKNIGLSFLGFSLMVLAILIFIRFSEPLMFREFFEKMSLYSSENSYLNGLVLILAGCIITFIVQSSSVATSIFLMMLGKIITIEHALYLVMGANIGTTFIVLLAQLFFYPKSKSIARFHVGFNLLGNLIFFFFVPSLLDFFKSFLPNDEYILAFFHSFFNVVTASVVLPFIHFYPMENDEKSSIEVADATSSVDFLGYHRDIFENQLIFSAHKLKQSISLLQRISTESSPEKINEIIDRIKKNETQSDELIRSLQNSLILHKNAEVQGSWIPNITAKIHCAHLLEKAEDTILKISYLHQERKKNHFVITPKLRMFIFEMDEMLLDAAGQLLIFWGKSEVDKKEMHIKASMYAIAEKAEKHLIKNMKNHSVNEVTALHFKEIITKYKLMSDIFSQLFACVLQSRKLGL